MPCAKELASLAVAASFEFSTEAREALKVRILDSLGCAVATSHVS